MNIDDLPRGNGIHTNFFLKGKWNFFSHTSYADDSQILFRYVCMHFEEIRYRSFLFHVNHGIYSYVHIIKLLNGNEMFIIKV